MQIRVVTDQAWDVPADILVVPIAGEPDWASGSPLAELDRRAGGRLRDLGEFGELKHKRFSTALTAGGGEIKATRVLAVGGGERDDLDLESARRIAASAERRLAGRAARRGAVRLGARRPPTPPRRAARPPQRPRREAWSREASSPSRCTAWSSTRRPPSLT